MPWEALRDFAPWLTYLLLPATWWAATITAKVDRLHSAFSKVQTLASKVAVLEERTGGTVVLGRD